MENIKTPKTYAELVRLISAILPDASFDEDLEGQLIIYTNLRETQDGNLAQFEAE